MRTERGDEADVLAPSCARDRVHARDRGGGVDAFEPRKLQHRKLWGLSLSHALEVKMEGRDDHSNSFPCRYIKYYMHTCFRVFLLHVAVVFDALVRILGSLKKSTRPCQPRGDLQEPHVCGTCMAPRVLCLFQFKSTHLNPNASRLQHLRPWR